ncbi:MAG: hypothetical protein HY722_04235 [Planctomycetes bacterium]|nr:hypothetical protein [Planctomycetota bacterium]
MLERGVPGLHAHADPRPGRALVGLDVDPGVHHAGRGERVPGGALALAQGLAQGRIEDDALRLHVHHGPRVDVPQRQLPAGREAHGPARPVQVEAQSLVHECHGPVDPLHPVGEAAVGPRAVQGADEHPLGDRVPLPAPQDEPGIHVHRPLGGDVVPGAFDGPQETAASLVREANAGEMQGDLQLLARGRCDEAPVLEQRVLKLRLEARPPRGEAHAGPVHLEVLGAHPREVQGRDHRHGAVDELHDREPPLRARGGCRGAARAVPPQGVGPAPGAVLQPLRHEARAMQLDALHPPLGQGEEVPGHDQARAGEEGLIPAHRHVLHHEAVEG